eukprot:CAMPEP_0184484724 /NCGR_PEP_ID=MMETSP0113_2-20130426/6401_1 /TAXON_ID=91329 /ORGANISM="Norrisiella sphaerica, Strain BC52" /LENGTH=446 /DNA_ID=CAMNT_0026865831 /DNA_START=99 /DNA_END=1436 /DNA_ORIENTATION=+
MPANLLWAGSYNERMLKDGKTARCPELAVLPHNTETVVGRGKNCDVRVKQKLVSRVHAKITRAGGKWLLIDVSTNGTYVNGTRINNIYLNDNDFVAFGALGPLCQVGEFQENYKSCGTLFRFNISPEKDKEKSSSSKKSSAKKAAAIAISASPVMRCEMCKKVHSGQWGSGRFCTQSCAAQYSRKRGSQAGSSNKKRARDNHDIESKSKRTKKRSAPKATSRLGPKSKRSKTERLSKAETVVDEPEGRGSRSRRPRSPPKRSLKATKEQAKEPLSPPLLESPPPPERKERLLRPSMMTIHQGTKFFRVQAKEGVRCHEAKDFTKYVRPELLVRYGTLFPATEISGSWVRVEHMWLPIKKGDTIYLKEDEAHRRLHNLHVTQPFTKQTGKTKKRKKKGNAGSLRKKSTSQDTKAKESKAKEAKSKELKSKLKEKFVPCEICGKNATW